MKKANYKKNTAKHNANRQLFFPPTCYEAKISSKELEGVPEEPTPAEIAYACKDILSSEACEEIRIQKNTDEALGLAFTALIEAGIDDPEGFLIEKGILEETE